MTLSQGIICHLGMRHWPSMFLPFSLWWQNCYPLIYDAAWSHQAGSFTVRSAGEHHWLATRSAPCLKSSCLGLGSPASTLPLHLATDRMPARFLTPGVWRSVQWALLSQVKLFRKPFHSFLANAKLTEAIHFTHKAHRIYKWLWRWT